VTRSIVSPEYEQLRQLLVQARKAAQLTQEALAARLGRPQSFVAKYEGGERRLDVIEFIEVARALGADPARIVRKLAALHAEAERR
jgi:transcriptional regulator with XRE-family HTH domain